MFWKPGLANASHNCKPQIHCMALLPTDRVALLAPFRSTPGSRHCRPQQYNASTPSPGQLALPTNLLQKCAQNLEKCLCLSPF